MNVFYLDKDNKVLSKDSYVAMIEGTVSLSALEVAEIRAKAIFCTIKKGERIIVTDLSLKDFLADEAKKVEVSKVANDFAVSQLKEVQ